MAVRAALAAVLLARHCDAQEHSCAVQCHYTGVSRATAAPQPRRRPASCRCRADAVLPTLQLTTRLHAPISGARQARTVVCTARCRSGQPWRSRVVGAGACPAAVAHQATTSRAHCLRRGDQKRVKPASSTTMCKPGKRAGVRRRGGRPACCWQARLLSVARHCTHPLAGPAASGRAQHALGTCGHTRALRYRAAGHAARAPACRLQIQNGSWWQHKCGSERGRTRESHLLAACAVALGSVCGWAAGSSCRAAG
jgi:hypothetical protein